MILSPWIWDIWLSAFYSKPFCFPTPSCHYLQFCCLHFCGIFQQQLLFMFADNIFLHTFQVSLSTEKWLDKNRFNKRYQMIISVMDIIVQHHVAMVGFCGSWQLISYHSYIALTEWCCHWRQSWQHHNWELWWCQPCHEWQYHKMLWQLVISIVMPKWASWWFSVSVGTYRWVSARKM